MQAGGKIEVGEAPLSALSRELREEIGLSLEGKNSVQYLGCFSAPAANEPDYSVEAEIYHVRVSYTPIIGSEIEEAIWIDTDRAEAMPLAPLTRVHVLPLSRRL